MCLGDGKVVDTAKNDGKFLSEIFGLSVACIYFEVSVLVEIFLVDVKLS